MYNTTAHWTSRVFWNDELNWTGIKSGFHGTESSHLNQSANPFSGWVALWWDKGKHLVQHSPWTLAVPYSVLSPSPTTRTIQARSPPSSPPTAMETLSCSCPFALAEGSTISSAQKLSFCFYCYTIRFRSLLDRSWWPVKEEPKHLRIWWLFTLLEKKNCPPSETQQTMTLTPKYSFI